MSRFKNQGDAIVRLIEFCQWNAVSVEMVYSEPEDNMYVEVGYRTSPQELYVQKRVYDIDTFLTDLKEEWGRRGLTPSEPNET